MLESRDVRKVMEILEPGQRAVWQVSPTFGSVFTVVTLDPPKNPDSERRYTLRLGASLEKGLGGQGFSGSPAGQEDFGLDRRAQPDPGGKSGRAPARPPSPGPGPRAKQAGPLKPAGGRTLSGRPPRLDTHPLLA